MVSQTDNYQLLFVTFYFFLKPLAFTRIAAYNHIQWYDWTDNPILVATFSVIVLAQFAILGYANFWRCRCWD